MIWNLKENILEKTNIRNINFDENREYLCISKFKEIEAFADKIGIKKELLQLWAKGINSKFESNYGFDYISLIVPNMENPLKEPSRICIYFRGNLLAFISEDETRVNDIIRKVIESNKKVSSLSKILDLVFDKLTVEDTYVLDNIEQEISELEEAVMTSFDSDYINKIMIFRKKLLKLKRYYEQFYNIAEGIEENENELIDENSIKSFRILKNRIHRLNSSIINLRDYVSQVREAYQAQVDISQNSLMKIFTVVTSIFMPLTLIAGWYGMNLKIPEFNWDYGYPFVISLSCIVFISCIIFFKKKKWF